MTELFVFVEGRTEESFVKALLAPHLATADVHAQVRQLPTSRDERTRQPVSRGGGFFVTWERELRMHLRTDKRPELRFTTLWDLYALPRDFPGRDELARLKGTREKALLAEAKLAEAFGDPRLIPYVQRHEIETLLFADLDALKGLLDERDRKGLEVLRAEVRSLAPEDINDDPQTAPSKRLIKAIPSYRKNFHGPTALQTIGLPRIRERCPRFNEWVVKLEALGHRA
jgi:hypothetical protein